MKINGHGNGCTSYGGNSYGDCDGDADGDGYGDGYGYSDGCGNGNGNGYGGDGYSDGCGNGDGNGYGGDGSGDNTAFTLYHTTPFAYLTLRGIPHDATFENYMLHLQVEQLVHRRV